MRLDERLRFEIVLSRLLARLVHAPATDITTAVQDSLGEVVRALGADRAAFDVPGDRRVCWPADGVGDVPAILDAGRFPWTASALDTHGLVRFARTAALPAAAAGDRAGYERAGTRAHLSVTLRAGTTNAGVLSVETVRAEHGWPDELVDPLRRAAQAFADVLKRGHAGEHEIQRLRQELAHVGRVSAMGELTAALAHELNQPLTAILNNARVVQRILASEAVDVGEIREILADIVADDKRAAAVISRVRGLLRKGELEYASVEVNEIVTEIARLTKTNAAQRELSIRLDLADSLPHVLGDRIQLQQVVLNLVLNGLDAMRPGAERGCLLIRTFRADRGHVGVAVRDDGTGIAERDAAHIFEPLYTTKSDGMGMGLAIARTIVDAHSGRLTAENNAEGGATFRFTLPVDRAAA